MSELNQTHEKKDQEYKDPDGFMTRRDLAEEFSIFRIEFGRELKRKS